MKPPGQHVRSPGTTCPSQHVTSPCPSRHWSPHFFAHGHAPMSREHEPPRQLHDSPVLARMTHDVRVPLALQLAVRVNVTLPSHALPQAVEAVPGQRSCCEGQV